MLLLHISDIHFNHPLCSTAMDPDRPYRTHLIRDAKVQCAELGSPDALMVGGDIAYHGTPEEYGTAIEWILELGQACGCPPERIYVVPGNHDVDRRITAANLSVRNAQAAILNASDRQREKELFGQFRDSQTGQALLAPIAAYNAFAAKFNCQVYPPEKMFWRQELPLDGQTALRLYGLTSTLLSGFQGNDDTHRSLYLSPLQTVLDPADGIVNLAMCHHPPDWLMDNDKVDEAICSRGTIHLFAHKHRQRLHRDKNYIRFSAGAVNPDRHEPGWEPGYNLIKLSIVEEGARRLLEVEAHLRMWQSNPDMFIPKMESAGERVFRHRVPVSGMVARTPSDYNSPRLAIQAPDPSPAAPNSEGGDLEAKMSNENTRNLVLRFWMLASSERREIALALGLIDDSDMRLPEPERYGRALVRAGDRGLLEKVAQEIARREKH